MRGFLDEEGQGWEVVAGRESWGAFFAIFVPEAPGGPIRETQLQSGTWGEAQRELAAADERALRELLGRSIVKSLG